MAENLVLVVITSNDERDFAEQVASALGCVEPIIVVGTPLEAAQVLRDAPQSPSYLVIDIHNRGFDVLSELDVLAEYCSQNARVVVTGDMNDVTFYRDLRQRGIVEYFTRPARISDIRRALVFEAQEISRVNQKSEIICFHSAASGDGASTVALNTAYALATYARKSVVVIDMDFQFGLIARNLDLTTQFGIKEIFEHPERSIDSTLVDKMLAEYAENLKIISAPQDLRYYPQIKPEMVRDLLYTLKQRFDYIIVDLPHVWAPWSAAAISDSSRIFIIGQLWLRSLTHTTRILTAWKNVGIDDSKVSLIINRSGAKFTEAVRDRDFEQASGKKINFLIPNDIKTVVMAENQGKSVMQIGSSALEKQFRAVASFIAGGQQSLTGLPEKNTESSPVNQTERKGGVLSFLKKG